MAYTEVNKDVTDLTEYNTTTWYVFHKEQMEWERGASHRCRQWVCEEIRRIKFGPDGGMQDKSNQ